MRFRRIFSRTATQPQATALDREQACEVLGRLHDLECLVDTITAGRPRSSNPYRGGMDDIERDNVEEIISLLGDIRQLLEGMRSDVAAVRKAIETNGDLDHRLGHIEAAIDSLAK